MALSLLQVYILNLTVTLAMFLVLIFRAWIEYRNYRVMWEDIRRRREYDAVAQVLRVEKNLFMKVEGGEELYRLLCRMFNVES